MMVCRDCYMQPVRVGDTVSLRYDKQVGFGEWDDAHVDCEVCGRPKNGLPILAKVTNGNIVELDFDPEMDLEKIELTQEQEAILNADMEAEMQRLQPELYEV